RPFGIEVRIDPSWVLIFVLLTWNLVVVFGRWHEAWSGPEVFAVAVAATLVFYGCIIVHELAHALVARVYGAEVRSVTLFLFGGVSNLAEEPPSAQAEFLMAIAGPLASFALGIAAILLGAALMPRDVTSASEAVDAFARLGPVATV